MFIRGCLLLFQCGTAAIGHVRIALAPRGKPPINLLGDSDCLRRLGAPTTTPTTTPVVTPSAAPSATPTGTPKVAPKDTQKVTQIAARTAMPSLAPTKSRREMAVNQRGAGRSHFFTITGLNCFHLWVCHFEVGSMGWDRRTA